MPLAESNMRIRIRRNSVHFDQEWCRRINDMWLTEAMPRDLSDCVYSGQYNYWGMCLTWVEMAMLIAYLSRGVSRSDRPSLHSMRETFRRGLYRWVRQQFGGFIPSGLVLNIERLCPHPEWPIIKKGKFKTVDEYAHIGVSIIMLHVHKHKNQGRQ